MCTYISVNMNINTVPQFRKFQQALEEEFGDDIEIVSFQLCYVKHYENITFLFYRLE